MIPGSPARRADPGATAADAVAAEESGWADARGTVLTAALSHSCARLSFPLRSAGSGIRRSASGLSESYSIPFFSIVCRISGVSLRPQFTAGFWFVLIA